MRMKMKMKMRMKMKIELLLGAILAAMADCCSVVMEAAQNLPLGVVHRWLVWSRNARQLAESNELAHPSSLRGLAQDARHSFFARIFV